VSIHILFTGIPRILGSYGATPKSVLEAVNQLTLRIEANPDLFHRVEYQPLLINSRQKIANLIGAKLDEVVLVSNASMGVNTVLRNFSWEEGDIIFACVYTRDQRCLESKHQITMSSHDILRLHLPNGAKHCRRFTLPNCECHHSQFPNHARRYYQKFQGAYPSQPC